MLVRDWMTRTVITVSPHMSILNARRLMGVHGVRHLPVVLGDEVIGMVSDRDLRSADAAAARSLSRLQSDLVTGRYRRVESVMSAPVHVTRPTDSVEQAARDMVSRRISALPVEEHGRLVGMLSLTDCLRGLLAERRSSRDTRAIDIDTVITMPPGDERPGRSTPAPGALVVDADPSRRLRTRNDLVNLGYAVRTCPGPTSGVFCPAARGAAMRCARIADDTELVVVDPGSANPELAAAYRRWLPKATVRIGDHALAFSEGPTQS